jgi:diguanylate cyclase (GGDEF)-like protein/PAS domain S-box-containing protein
LSAIAQLIPPVTPPPDIRAQYNRRRGSPAKEALRVSDQTTDHRTRYATTPNEGGAATVSLFGRPHRPAAVAMIVVCCLYWAAEVSWSGDPTTWQTISNVFFLPLGPVLALCAWRAGRSWPRNTPQASAWRFVMWGVLSNGIGDIVWFIYETVLGQDPWISIADLFYLACYPLLVAGMATFHGSPRQYARRRAALTDLAIGLVGFAMVSWRFAIYPTLGAGLENQQELALALAYPVLSFLTVVGATSMALGGRSAALRTPRLMVASGFTLAFLGDICWTSTSLLDTYQSGNWIDSLYLAAYLVQALGMLAEPEAVRRAARADAEDPQPRIAIAAISSAVGFGALLEATYLSDGGSLPGLVIGALLLTVLLLFRQSGLVRENLDLVADKVERRSAARFATLIEHSSDLTLIVGERAVITWASPSAPHVIGWPANALVGRSLLTLVAGQDVGRVIAQIDGLPQPQAANSSAVPAMLRWTMTSPEGEHRVVEAVRTDLRNDAEVGGIVLNLRDVTLREGLQEQLTFQAQHDPLTGLANRAAFRASLAHMLQDDSQTCCPHVFLLDLDHFKHVNDSLGHAAGDALLVITAERIGDAIGPDGLAARLGGDEFAVMLPVGDGTVSALERANSLLAALSSAVEIDGHRIDVSASIGVAQSHRGSDPTDLLRNADLAMYVSKASGRKRATLFEQSMHDRVRDRLELLTDLRRAIQRDQLTLHFQAIVELATGRVVGAEALVRWIHPTRGLVGPGSFIGLAEESGLITDVGRWVLRTALLEAATWPTQPGTGRAPYLSVNLSPRELQEPSLVAHMKEALDATRFPAERLVVEVTESWLMENVVVASRVLGAMRELGVRIAMDDFGTGYSSLAYLVDLPLDILKIPKPFVERLGGEDADPSLAKAILGISGSLGLSVVAEGIEQQAQATQLLALGCNVGQGYFFHRPAPPDDLRARLGHLGPA